MMLLGGLVCVAVFRWAMMGSIPHPAIMIAIGVVAFLASLGAWAIMLRNNRLSFGLDRLWAAGRGDAVSNIAVIAAGAAVALTRSNIPDLVIGGIMAALFVGSGWRIATTGRLDAGRAS